MKLYKLAKISRGQREWYIYYYFRKTLRDKYERFRVYGKDLGLNREKNLMEKERIAQAIKEGTNELLKDDFNPYLTLDELTLKTVSSSVVQYATVTDALQYALEKKLPDYAPRTRNDRKNTIKHLISIIKKTGNNCLIQDLKGMQVAFFMERLRIERKLSNIRYNAYLETLTAMFNVLVQSFVIEYNPSKALVKLKEQKPKAHKQPTDEERQIIFTYAKEQKFEAYVFLKIIYRGMPRPNEILDWKPGNVDPVNLRIRVDEDSAKDDEERWIAIDPDLMTDILILMDKCKPSEYIFSHNLLPGPDRINRNRWSEIYKNLIKDDNGLGHLGIKYTSYSFKGKGANTRRRMGNKLSEVSKHAGHATEKMTLNYATEEQLLEDERIRKIIPPCE